MRSRPLVSPPSSRSVSATRASIASTGWQHMKISPSRSSPTCCAAASSAVGSAEAPSARSVSIACAICSCFFAGSRRGGTGRSRGAWRSPSARRPGSPGRPTAATAPARSTSASCARSSARPTSRTIRVSPAISRGDSIRQTASIVRCRSLAPSRRPSAYCRVLAHLLVDLLGALLQLGRELLAEVLGLEHLADLDLRRARHRVGAALDPLDALLERLRPARSSSRRRAPSSPRTVRRRRCGCRRRTARARPSAGLQALAGQHHAGLRQLLVVSAHLGEHLLARASALPRCPASP